MHHHHHTALNHPIIYKLMCTFYLQHPPSLQQFYPWDIGCLLSLLESWVPTSSLSNFKLSWKTATLLAFVTGKHCFDLILLHVDNSSFFFSIMLIFLFMHLMVKWIGWIIFKLKFILNLIPLLISVLYFT